ncbi:PREDICTED: F-box/FBD/LRR-repeat protein At3g26920-like isoform X2 [Camelina sativa]|nr:PREDICTED: F-box/FBD/LRR-repeat protein At3g26920-like isoform X2 [Camelina sativa]
MSVLAKRWRYLWKMVPSLEFGYFMFSDNVSRCLLSNQDPVLQRLCLRIDYDYNSNMDIGVLMGIAFGLHVRNLELYVYAFEKFRFPTSLCNSESLETLKLSDAILVDVPSPICLKSLRTLHLHGVVYKDDESVSNLLSGCVSLENLVVHRFQQSDVNTFTIAVPSLQRLTLTSENDDEDSIYVINAPSLKYLEFQGVLDDNTFVIKNSPELVEASLRDIFDVFGHPNISVFENILRSLTSVKRLSLEILAPSKIKFPTGSIFFQLVYLELDTYEPMWWNVLMLMLDSSPNLQVLKLIRKSWRREDPEAYMKWNKPKYVPKCLLLHLETLVWKNYQGEIEDEKEVAKYILTNASRLKKATFSNAYIRPETSRQRLKELRSVVMASNSCKLVFKGHR